MAYEISVTIGDTTLTSSSPHTSINIPNQAYTHAASGGSITIANSTGTARVEQTPPIADGTNDALRLISLKITANNASVNNFPITFMRQMTQGPNAPPDLWYITNGIGTFQQAGGSFILWKQFVKNPLTAGFTALGSKQYTPGSPSFNLKITSGHKWLTPPNMAGDRVLRVEVTFNLVNGKYLDLPNGIKIYSSLQPDPEFRSEPRTQEPIKKK
jgi:hypothetical protein